MGLTNYLEALPLPLGLLTLRPKIPWWKDFLGPPLCNWNGLAPPIFPGRALFPGNLPILVLKNLKDLAQIRKIIIGEVGPSKIFLGFHSSNFN